MPSFRTDEALWYNVGVWGELGYAVPNFGNDPTTVNTSINYLATVMGRNLSAIMHHDDVDSRVPPSINTLVRIHKLIIRARTILDSRAVASNQFDMEPRHSSPAPQDFIIFPVPYFLVRNQWLKEYCGLILNALCECYQHTENRQAFEFSQQFAGLIGQYLQRVYRNMCVELFLIPKEQASDPAFMLTEEMLKAYKPESYFTSTEMIDVVPPIAAVPTEDDLLVLTNGIPATQLVGLTRWPSASAPPTGMQGSPTGAAATSSSAGSTPAFAPPPGP